MFAQSLRRLQDALNAKADRQQREFIAVSEALKAVGRRLLEAGPDAREPLLGEQAALHERQHALAESVNHWRDLARAAARPTSDQAARAFLGEMERDDDPDVRAAAGRALFVMDAPEEELEKLARQPLPARGQAVTAAGRLLQRAQTEFDLRRPDPARWSSPIGPACFRMKPPWPSWRRRWSIRPIRWCASWSR